jgi:hypothetical protein
LNEPEYLTCLKCHLHSFNFDWIDGRLVGAVCAVCGNEDLQRFALPDDFEAPESS